MDDPESAWAAGNFREMALEYFMRIRNEPKSEEGKR